MRVEQAPIGLFVFKRPEHTLRTLESLACNSDFARSKLTIFSDGPRGDNDKSAVLETRRIVENFDHPAKTIMSSDQNLGLANSIAAGVTHLCNTHGKVIVVEDDLIVGSGFLNYMNGCLAHYENEDRVMQVSGFMHDVNLSNSFDCTLLPHTTSWGWATWKRAWDHYDEAMKGSHLVLSDKRLKKRFDLMGSYPYSQMIQAQRAGKIDSWAIRWYLSVFLRDGLVVHPKKTLVSNSGFDRSGTHGRLSKPPSNPIISNDRFETLRYPEVRCDIENLSILQNHLLRQRGLRERGLEMVRMLRIILSKT